MLLIIEAPNYSIPISQKSSANQQIISNLVGIATKVLLEFHNYFPYSPIISYNPLISHNQSRFRSRDIANPVLLNDNHKLRS
jgi:hypothetical protein